MKMNVKSLLPHILTIVFALVLSTLYFTPQISGKVTVSGDSSGHIGASKELKDFRKENGESTLWTNSLFSGMPTYQISFAKTSNYIQYLNRVGMLFIPRPIGYYIFGMLAFYFSLILLKINPWVSFFGAVCFAFNTYSLVLYDTGHFSKIIAIIPMMPLVVGLILTFKKKYLLGGFLFAIGLSLSLHNNHYQMTYYLGMMLLVYVIVEFVHALKYKELKPFLKTIMVLVVGTFLALGSNASKILTTKEYAEDTMRGKSILESAGQGITSSSETKGLEWNYAMQWSNGPMDVLAAYIPGIVGGSSGEAVGNKSASVKEFKKYNQRIKRAPLYWGKMQSTAGPAYFGAVLMLLFVLSFFVLSRKLILGLGLSILLGVLISLGDSFSFLNGIFYDYVPLFNKFRAHGSIMAVIILLVCLMGGLGLSKILKSENKQEIIKRLFWATGILVSISLIFILFGNFIFDFDSASDARYQSSGFNIEAFIQDRQSLMRSDAFRSLVFVLLGSGLIYLYLKNKIRLNIMMPLLILLAFIDIAGIGKRYLNNDDFVTEKRMKNIFTPSAADLEILKDPDVNYRVANQSVNSFNDNMTSYYHKSIGGYHAAKLQRYQDIIDKHLLKGNMKVYNMLNTKYFIIPSEEGGSTKAQRNPGAMGNAWFVNDIKIVKTANEEIDALNNIDLTNMAVVHNEFEQHLDGLAPPENASIKLDSYSPKHLSYTSTNDVQSFVVFSEVWYGPDKGWKVLIDGKEDELIRANYVLRGVCVPKGKHKIEMIFEPSSYHNGELISMISSLLLIVLGGWILFKKLIN